jgi:hypothetical protein
MWTKKKIKNIYSCFTERQRFTLLLMIISGFILYLDYSDYLLIWCFCFIVYLYAIIDYHDMWNDFVRKQK